MTLFVIAFVSGMLTALAPCVLPILPVVLGTVATQKSSLTPYVVIGSLGLSIVLFTILLKATTLFIVIPLSVWAFVSGAILLVFGLTLVFPHYARYIPAWRGGVHAMNQSVAENKKRNSCRGDILVGASLGPIFSSCSPTYFVILGTILPLSFFLGLFYICVYTLGLVCVLAVIALFGSAVMQKLTSFAQPNGLLKKSVGVLFIVLGLMISFGVEKRFEVWVLEHLPFDVTVFEHRLLEQFFYAHRT